MLNIIPIPALQDNYIWLLRRDNHAVIVDPGEAALVLDYLQANSLQLDAILCTHRHHDHVDGIEELRGVYNVPVHGRSHPKNPHITHDLREGDRLWLETLDAEFAIIEVPGHLDDHIAFIAPRVVFCGDVMFGGGCGKNFEGTPAQLLHSLQRLAALPDDTQVYCAHEYTSYNLPFALACEPDNPDVQRRIADTRSLRERNLSTVPFTIALEKATNPFLRCSSPELVRTLQARGLADTSELAVFTALREWRDRF
ncbi:hydroxyacylglutathione hydrolase [Sideroxydans lithotrophicus]|uniref:Hydroxyacylglutathione hydrolase n=1 Tax=Sideroxydans lithotrophicus (strain ES-1) TaxID=580332 RepID=D5CS09_SIDLE|nr:hydroxyacylglutathione hydrolase [Sideroxydans lithotrophicus]ADE11745.1 hydroxyacylglutathione hydrolase [Sideroxydans lithotrophicus ES-1]